MKALLVADTHWLWYAAGRWGAGRGYKRPRVDYMAMRNQVARFLTNRFGDIYDLECSAFVMNRRASMMARFIDLLQGFGYQVHECSDPTPVIVSALKTESWDLVVLAVGSVEALMATEPARVEGRRVVLAAFTPTSNGVDAVLILDESVLYEA